MSTAIRRSRLRSVIASACFVAAGAGLGCAQRASIVDDGAALAADGIASAVARASGLDDRCATMARHLAEAGIAASAPVSRRAGLEESEARAAVDYQSAGCPVRALPGIAFGVREAARVLSRRTAS